MQGDRGLLVPVCAVTSAFALSRTVPSPPPLSVACTFLERSPKVPCAPLFSPSVEQKPPWGLLCWACP